MKPLDATHTIEALVRFLRTSLGTAGFSRAVIALSGGVDSSVSAALAVRALGHENVYPLLLPYGNLDGQSARDARVVITSLGIPENNITQRDIQPLVDLIIPLERELKFATTIDNIRRGNVMARVRMILLYDYAKKRNALVVGTENKTEHLLGYFTRFGDEASDIEPLRNLYKTQVQDLARQLQLPEQIITKTPTAGLWEGQTDEEELGFSYAQADKILSMIVDKKSRLIEIVHQREVNFATTKRARSKLRYYWDVVEKVVKRMKDNEYKHHLPMIPSAK
ncbi:NAD+ synthase [Candidatus Gottesmanbacteria bacterium]|nr:NAD+ synthase [Candidatus Gottesmanbacteria bacterium]